MKKSSTKSVRIPSARSEDQPATRRMLTLVRSELIQRMDSGFHSLKSEIQKVGSGLHSLKSDIQKLEAGQFRMELLLEEQNSNNRIVLEGLQALWQRQESLEHRR